jgi:uncharacterized repeat protein (TIGR02543 family)
MKMLAIIAVFAALVSGCSMGSQNGDDNGNEPNGASFTVIFSANGGEGAAPPARTVERGSGMTLPGSGGLSLPEHTFGGWNMAANGTGTSFSAGATFTPTGNVTLFAEWVSNVTVIFSSNGGNGTAPSIRTGSSVTLPDGSGLSRPGFAFGGWNTNALGTGDNFNPGATFVPGDDVVILHAGWIPTTRTVTFNANGGTGTVPPAQTVAIGSSITLPGGDGLSRRGFAFVGWTTDDDLGTVLGVGTTYTPNGDVMLYARWDHFYGTFVPGSTLSEQLAWLQTNAQSDGDYMIEVRWDEPMHGQLVFTNRTNITIALRSIGGPKTIGGFTVGGGVTLSIDDVIITGGIIVNFGGTLIMNTGAENNSGVQVLHGGMFFMHGGTISGNRGLGVGVSVAGTGVFNMYGGKITEFVGSGVDLVGTSVFSMHGGTISNNVGAISNNINNPNAEGGGVNIRGNSSTFTMYGGIISNNQASRRGGGVRVDRLGNEHGNVFTMHGGTISGNIGGGVHFNLMSNFTMHGGTIIGNTGGGVSSNRALPVTMTMHNGAILGNISSESSQGVYEVLHADGGGVFVHEFVMRGGTIAGNSAGGSGGGIHSTQFNIDNGKISDNFARHNGGGVVGLDNSGSNQNFFTIQNSEISNNHVSGDGGGLWTFGMRAPWLRNVEIFGNRSGGDGGGAYFTFLDVSGRFSMIDGVVSNNHASGDGGGLWGSSYYLRNVEITGNRAGGNGGGVSGSAVTLHDGTISNNTAGGDGGGVSGSVTLHDGTVSNNTAGGDGGGIFGGLTMHNGEITGNISSGDGGGVFANVILNNGVRLPVVMEDGTISNNEASGGDGGGVWALELIMRSGEITGNKARGNGGGVNAGQITIHDGAVSGNEAGGDGGGVFTIGGGSFTMHRGAVSENIAGRNGGGVYMESYEEDWGWMVNTMLSTFTMHEGTIRANEAAGNGGGVYTSYMMTMHDGTISANRSGRDGGGVFNSGTFRMVYGTIYGSNAAGGLGNNAARGAALFNAEEAVAQQIIIGGGGAIVVSATLPTSDSTIAGW